MNYVKHYNMLINRARLRTLTEYAERHHVVPKCMGGTNKKENIVELTPEEHYVAHQLLIKMYPDVHALIYAANMMSRSSKTIKRNNKIYGWLKRKHLHICKQRVGSKNPSYQKYWYYDPTTLESGKYNTTEIPNGWIKGRILNKEKYAEKLSKIQLNGNNKLNKKLYAEALFDKFQNGNYKSLLDFVNKGHYDKSHEALRQLWKQYVPEYDTNSSQGTPFKSSGGSSEAERLASNQ